MNTPTPETDAFGFGKITPTCYGSRVDVPSTSDWRDFARRLERERDEARKERDNALAAGGFCDEHEPNGGHRNCLVCACMKLVAALSRIDYACGEQNEMGLSSYDLHADESQVVLRVRKLIEEHDALREQLEKLTGETK